MGFLEAGVPLDWESSKEFIAYVKEHGIQQFINTYNRVVNRDNDYFYWGDEIEYSIVSFHHSEERALLSMMFTDLVQKIGGEHTSRADFKPEYATWMIEATPAEPFKSFTTDLLKVEESMRHRRALITENLPPDHTILSTVTFPMLGVHPFTEQPMELHGVYSDSEYMGDEGINPHPRFGTLTRNIRTRRGSKVQIEVPVFRDKYTNPDLKTIDMDCMAFGMGSCCLQVTFQARNIEESRRLYDQLAVVSPIMLALSASGPLWRGLVADTDTRWDVISQCVDDRTPGERGIAPLAPGEQRIPKSRYSSMDMFICRCPCAQALNDIPIPYDEASFNKLLASGIDPVLSKHIAHLFVRDPLVIFKDRIYVDDMTTTEHFENVQSTNWQSVRWKPPPPSGPVEGWRVELRTMDLQITDFENAAVTVFSALINRALLYFGLRLYIPMSKVEENMFRANQRNSVLTQKFWFKKYLVPNDGEGYCWPLTEEQRDAYEEMTMLEILMGQDDENSVGLVPLVRAYLSCIGADSCTIQLIDRYLQLIIGRAQGTIMTGATWIRHFVESHPDYAHDSIITQKINYDLLKRIDEISSGKVHCEELLGPRLASCDCEPEGILMRGASFDSSVVHTATHHGYCSYLRELIMHCKRPLPLTTA